MFRMRNQIKLSQLHTHPLNPRKHLDIEELASSIKESGLLSPIIVRRIGFEKFQIISGHRRKAALDFLGEKTGDCDVVEMTDEQAYKSLMTANIQSHSLSEIEEAEGIKHMLDAYEWTQERVAKEFGKTQAWISKRISLLSLPNDLQEMVITRVINPSQANEISKLPQDKQQEVAAQVIEEHLSKRETAELVKQIKVPEISDTSGRPADTYRQVEQQEQVEPANCSFANDATSHHLAPVDHPTSDALLEKNENLPAPRMVNKKIKASDYITKFYEFLANLDDETVDGIIELDETPHFLAVIDKAQEQLTWMRSKVTKAGETNVVEFRRNPA